MSEVLFSVIVPTLNERENIGPFLEKTHSTLEKIPHEIIVVDDDSSDGTGEIVRNFAAKNPAIRLITRKEKKGLSAAVIEGFLSAKGDCLGVMDADFSHDHDLLPKLFDAVHSGRALLAVGSRRVSGGGADHWPWYRRLLSSGATHFGKIWLGLKLRDPMSGFFVIRRDVFDSVKDQLNPKGYKILLELYVRARIQNFVEIPFIFKDRKQGYSKLTTSIALLYLSMLWDLRAFSLPFRRISSNS